MTQPRRAPRNGATAVEFAVVAPLVFLLFFAAYEFARLNMLRHTVEMAAFEGARRGIVQGATAGDARERARQILAAVGAVGETICVTPETIGPQTEKITVEVRLPLEPNAWVPPHFLRGVQVERQFTLGREGVAWNIIVPPSPSVP